ncbi:MAG: hypothetical protein EOS04_24075 [Mesorhizobium sp.]|nr:MAG: hypothetical protein EOR98_26410 [Mesorhizobium sp.]RWN73219.1 MAG: hypothetical protein EOS01_27145 [Mesorhizobium sp.]RWN85127.1 MAG: hypothetical protein EOS04_24075 [Mesorhizobium sp.]
MEKELEDMTISERLRDSAKLERDTGYCASEHELNEAAEIIDALVAALDDSVRLMEAMGQSAHRSTLNKARAALALARGGK